MQSKFPEVEKTVKLEQTTTIRYAYAEEAIAHLVALDIIEREKQAGRSTANITGNQVCFDIGLISKGVSMTIVRIKEGEK